jgi:hypothetical protein
MEPRSFAPLAVVLLAVGFCSAFTSVEASFKNENEPRKYPTAVSCYLTMSKADSNDTDAFNRLPYSCNDFFVQNADEYKFVEVGCRFAQVLQGAAFKVENAACHASRAYATCRVFLDSQPNEPIDTYYFLGKDSGTRRDAQEEQFRRSCDTLGGEFLK